MFRAFILKASEGRTAPDFSLKSLAGSGGRMDLVCRCIIGALLTPEGVDRECRLTVVLEGPPDPPLSVRFEGAGMERAPEGEVEAAEVLLAAMRGIPPKGVSASREGFGQVLRAHAREGFPLYYLHEAGEDFFSLVFGERAAFVLGDQKGIDPAGERMLDSLGARRVSLGPHPYLASHCITIVKGFLP
ncbi:MAG: tRNA (pseudouridine(54)-N(1))-methyltransferase TrmY [Candidatus Verstraetearchaeota archaeon]|nr:tRNA (pseudouridine(54)-N(1))-methyltransferase TrmY [Candidatus Verstraetearchaeota archaeon]